jgi:hypothetical protein
MIRRFMICRLRQIKEDELGRTCGRYRIVVKCIKSFVVAAEGKRLFE